MPQRRMRKLMPKTLDDGEPLIAAWRTNDRVTTFLIENLPRKLWPQSIPGLPRKTVRSIASHLHNARCAWIRGIGGRHGVVVAAIASTAPHLRSKSDAVVCAHRIYPSSPMAFAPSSIRAAVRAYP